ncbi:MAG: response regulator [Candidatus Gastranaerophilales bacterium]|nr:response regulator [Candidatus Gastranaerophilales bacterium]
MLVKAVLIVDKRKEQCFKYKKMLENTMTSVFFATKMPEILNVLNSYEPDLILISDSIDDSICDTIKRLRVLSFNMRPVIVALSKSDHIQDRIDVLDSGADDFLSEPIDHNEFKARISAHLRRHFENNIYEKTGLFDSKITLKTLKRTINQKKDWAAILIDIDNFDFYKEIYGELAADKMLQTYIAIINNIIDENDFAGQIQENDFLILTNPYKAEKLAQYLVCAFDTVVEKFYSESDASRGYILTNGDEHAGNKVSLVSTSLGVVSNQYKNYTNVRQVVNALVSMLKLAKVKDGSAFIMERPKIAADNAVEDKTYNANILIIEPDEALSLLLSTTAQMQGYETMVLQDYSAIDRIPDEFIPAVIILDAGNTEALEGLAFCQVLKSEDKYKNSKIILSTTIHDKEKILNAGADVYIPKPYELSLIFNWVEKFMKKFNTL